MKTFGAVLLILGVIAVLFLSTYGWSWLIGIAHPAKTTIWIWGVLLIVAFVTKGIESVLEEITK
ncbi:MAG: hypothetical protein ACXAB9_13040 [Candidatus Thorarchaeota archaeon]|jgi:hypothetical protein